MKTLLENSLEIAHKAHATQVDKIGMPYIHHPQNVVMLLTLSPAFFKLSQEDKAYALSTAWLHDVLEDTDVSEKELLKNGIPQIVIDNVKLLSRHLHKPETYYQNLLTSPIARCVKVADVAHNVMPERLSQLDGDTQKRLKVKYTHALSFILDASEIEWFNRVTSNSLYPVD
jgi:(p)ppGpp synthase/HD superfamily hydrolase